MAASTTAALLLFFSVSAVIASVKHSRIKTLRVFPQTFRFSDDARCSSSHTPVPPSTANVDFFLTHIYSNCSPFHPRRNSTWRNSVWRTIANDAQRYRHLTSRFTSAGATQTDVDVLLGPDQAGSPSNYIIQASFGTPPQTFVADADTGSNVVWITCNGCSGCSSSTDVRPFDVSKSLTAHSVTCTDARCQLISERERSCSNATACGFSANYGDSTSVSGPLISDTLNLPSGTVESFVFGCATQEMAPTLNPPRGIAGLGRGGSSLISQTANQFGKKFSYCLPSYSSSGLSGRLTLGSTSSAMEMTSLVASSARPSFYYVGLRGISVGGSPVDIPAGALSPNEATGGGTIIDSGTVITRLIDDVYGPFRDAFREKARESGLREANGSTDFLDTCFQIPSMGAHMPAVTFNFESGVDLELTAEQTLIADRSNGDGSIACLAFATPPAISEGGISIFGNFQQQDLLVVYDVPNSKLGFGRQKCS